MVSFFRAAQSHWLSFLLLLTAVFSATFFAHFRHLSAMPSSYWQGYMTLFVHRVSNLGLLLCLLGGLVALSHLRRLHRVYKPK